MRLPHLIALLALCVPALFASGISTHFEAADLSVGHLDAITYPDLNRILRAYPATYRIGAIYPDWGYLSPETSAAAEASHWPPFHEQALRHLHETYGEPWGAFEEQLFAFFCGLTCHGEMDDVWHFGSTAFLNEAMARDFAGWPAEISDPAVEIGTDFLVQVEQRPGREDPTWWVPVGDMVLVSARAGHPEISRGDVLLGTSLQRAGLWLEDNFSKYLYPIAALMMPWTQANYMTWWDGGVYDGAEASARRLESYWNEYQIIAAGGFASSHGGTHSEPCHTGPLTELARGLVADGVISVPVEELPRGVVLLHEPVVHDVPELTARLRELAASLHRAAR